MKGNRTQCRILKRCFFIVATISLLPIGIVYLVTTDAVSYRIKNFELQYENETQNQSTGEQHNTKTISQTEMEITKIVMEHRSQYLNKKCSEFGLSKSGKDSLHKPNTWEFLINKEHHLIWCNVFKAASTSWMYNFNLLAGYSPQFLKKSNVVPLVLARKRYPRPSLKELQDAMKTSVTFLIVRHPFERLLSAYRDKIQYAIPYTFHQKLGNQIIRKYRQKTPNQETKNIQKYPSFSEFVTYLLDERGKTLDMHWTPITEFCTPCQVNFDVIAKFETLEDDQKYLIEKADLQKVISPQWKNSGKGKSTKDLVLKYYSELTRTQVEELYEFFRYDFELFNYTYEEYLNNSNTETPIASP